MCTFAACMHTITTGPAAAVPHTRRVKVLSCSPSTQIHKEHMRRTRRASHPSPPPAPCFFPARCIHCLFRCSLPPSRKSQGATDLQACSCGGLTRGDRAGHTSYLPPLLLAFKSRWRNAMGRASGHTRSRWRWRGECTMKTNRALQEHGQ